MQMQRSLVCFLKTNLFKNHHLLVQNDQRAFTQLTFTPAQHHRSALRVRENVSTDLVRQTVEQLCVCVQQGVQDGYQHITL